MKDPKTYKIFTRIEIPFQLLKRVSEQIRECWCGAALWSDFWIMPIQWLEILSMKSGKLLGSAHNHVLIFHRCAEISLWAAAFQVTIYYLFLFPLPPLTAFSSHFFRRWEVSPSQRKASNCDVITKHHPYCQLSPQCKPWELTTAASSLSPRPHRRHRDLKSSSD